MALHIHQFMCLSDNYGVLVHEPDTGATAAIDVPDADKVLEELACKGWTLTDIFITHHHADHTQGIPGVKAKFPEARIVGPAAEAARFGGVDLGLGDGDSVRLGKARALAIEVPGHTAGHIAFWFEAEDLLFAGDTLFALGCGRVFETPLPVMYHSLMKLAALPGETVVYCGHEYTQSNAKFAMTVDPHNTILEERVAEIDRLRAEGAFTLPTTITLERATNPFLRAEDAGVQAALGMPNADPAAVFAELRERKNRG